MRRLAVPVIAFSIALVPAALVGACGDDSQHLFNTGGGGNGATVAASTTAVTVTATVASTGAGFTDCAHCVAPDFICVDDTSCADACPGDRPACNTETPVAPNPPVTTCCAENSTCCPGIGHDFCGPPGQGCPLLCPDGTTTCPNDNRCQLDPSTNTYGCIAETDCQNAMKCDGGICCPLGSKCENGTCPLPDLSIDQDYLTNSLELWDHHFDTNACEIGEGCVDEPGDRNLLRFSLRSPNTGDGDLFLGNPLNNDLFVYSDCHDHFHFTGYAEYRLLDPSGNVAATGHKQAFCLLDFDPLDGTTTDGVYNCSFQGIQKGWSDIYYSGLPCQWVDITGVAPGDYNLEITLNFEHLLAESDYTNNQAVFPVHIGPDGAGGAGGGGP